MAQILLVEDEPDLRRIITFNLQQAGHTPAEAGGGLEGLRLARKLRPDLILLDLMLPDLPGQEVCRSLKTNPTTRLTPVIMVTARGEVEDRVQGLELGAEDYIVKPFSVRELLLRIGILLRRQATTAPASASELVRGAVRLDLATNTAWVDGEEIALLPPEARLLARLLDYAGREQSRATLTDIVWGAGADIDDEQLDTLIERLRQKLGNAGACIERGRGAAGYSFRKESV